MSQFLIKKQEEYCKEQYFRNLLAQRETAQKHGKHYEEERQELLTQITEATQELIIKKQEQCIWKYLDTLGSKKSADLTIRLSSLLKNCREPVGLIKPQQDFSFFQQFYWEWPPANNDNPAFDNIKQCITDIEKLLSELAIIEGSEPIIISLEIMKEHYSDYIDKVCAVDEQERQFLLVKPNRIRSKDFPHHALTPEASQQLLSSEKNNTSGKHVVQQYRGVHYKHSPYAQGVEFMVNSLNNAIFGAGSPPTQLLKIIDNQGYHHALQASKSVEGTELLFILEQHPEYIDKINPESFSGMVVSGLLVNHHDGKPDNFIAKIHTNAQNEVVSIDITGIDNDIAFALAFLIGEIGSTEGKHYINIRNVLYFFPHMDQPIDANFRAGFLAKKPLLIIIEWLASLYKKNNEYKELLKKKIFVLEEFQGNPDVYPYFGTEKHRTCPYNVVKQNEHGLQLPNKFSRNFFLSIYQTLSAIQDAMRADENLTHNQLFKIIQPYVYYYYQAVKAKYNNNIIQCIRYLYLGELDGDHKGQPHALESVGIKRAKENPAARGTGVHTEISSKSAFSQEFERERTESLEDETQRFIAAIDFRNVGEREELLFLNALKDLNYVTQLTLQGTKTLNNHTFLPYLLTFPHLTEVQFIYAQNISFNAINSVLNYYQQEEPLHFILHDNCQTLSAKECDQLALNYPKCFSISSQGKLFKLDRYHRRPQSLMARIIRNGLTSQILLNYCLLIFRESRRADLNMRYDGIGEHGGTFLHEVVLQNHNQIAPLCDFLLKNGIDKTAVNKNHETALDVVIRQLNSDTVTVEQQRRICPVLRCLLKHGTPTDVHELQEAEILLKDLSPSPLSEFFKSHEKTSHPAHYEIGLRIFGFFDTCSQLALACANKEINEFVAEARTLSMHC